MPLDKGGIRAQRIAVTWLGVEALVFEPGSLARHQSLSSNHWTTFPICTTYLAKQHSDFHLSGLMLIDPLLCIKPAEEDRVSLVLVDARLMFRATRLTAGPSSATAPSTRRQASAFLPVGRGKPVLPGTDHFPLCPSVSLSVE